MICLLTVISVRREPNDRSEIITQLLFGETCNQIENDVSSNFIKIRADFDGYEGWVDEKQLEEISSFDLELYKSNQTYSIGTLNTMLVDESISLVPLGAVIQHHYLEKQEITFVGESSVLTKNELITTATKYMNTPYLWGGKSQFGIDCSGFVQQVFKVCGIDLPRDAYQQVEKGQKITFDDLEEGDLAYFGKDKITHVGIVLKDKRIIHAHGFVRISEYDDKGILKDGLDGYSHLAKSYRRV